MIEDCAVFEIDGYHKAWFIVCMVDVPAFPLLPENAAPLAEGLENNSGLLCATFSNGQWEFTFIDDEAHKAIGQTFLDQGLEFDKWYGCTLIRSGSAVN